MRNRLAVFLLLFIPACSNAIQLTSGKEYVEARDASGLRPIDADIARIAAVEPNLRFPARIGVARIVNGALTLPPATEGELLAEVGATHVALGEFVQVSPLIASMVTGLAPEGATPEYRQTHAGNVVQDIRKTAARQHLDYVLIYEMGARSRDRDTVFALADVTLIGGAILPTRRIKVAGVGQAIFLDVRTGYPYGTAQTAVDLSGLGRSFDGGRRKDALRERATDKVFAALVPEVAAMFGKLVAGTPTLK